jgi:sugar phosphate isomerase/epimerase
MKNLKTTYSYKAPPSGAGAAIKLATSLFSYAYEWNSGQYSLEDMFGKTKEYALGDGIEIVGFQSLKGYPYLSENQISEVKNLLDKYEFVPVCLDANVDLVLKRNHFKTIDETVDYLIPQIKAAQQLRFPILRVQMTAKPEVLKKLVSFAEKSNVKLGMELHTPYSVDNPSVMALRELYEEIDSPYLGFIPDMGTCMRNIPDALLYSFKSVGVTDEMIEITKEIWQKDVPMPAKFGELFERTSALGATPPQIGRLNMAFSMNGRQPIEMWKEVMPRVVHIHGKFYGFDEFGNEPSIDYNQILKVFSESGYKGYISSEYEGSAFTDEFSAFEMVRKHQELCGRILSPHSPKGGIDQIEN